MKGKPSPGNHVSFQSLLPEVLLSVVGVMSSRLLCGAGAVATQALSARGPNRVAAVHSMASGGGVPTDDDQATGLEREVMKAARKGPDPYNILAPKAAAGTKEDPNLVPSITKKQIAGCICKGDDSIVILFWLHKGEPQRCPSCGTHYKLVLHQLAH
ncbi:cytochrome c oxidase subunit 5B, mitochondrial-like [Ursus maritimus]|uniref:Cytochrome c oxidase subunit 5B, mitochondrial n=2 Tax=Ursus maritimus TaxID=29073 RepID=A0A8M1GTP9_URSMA|nr:cytochrome c oxidase subunit 5B, mitochondrial-like [Ursus maritimus]